MSIRYNCDFCGEKLERKQTSFENSCMLEEYKVKVGPRNMAWIDTKLYFSLPDVNICDECGATMLIEGLRKILERLEKKEKEKLLEIET